MSALNYRTWDMFLNQRIGTNKAVCDGYFEIELFASLMTEQTVEFIEQNFDLRLPSPVKIESPAAVSHILRQWRGTQPKLRIHGEFRPQEPIEPQLDAVVDYLAAISLCVDHPLTVQTIRFADHYEGLVLQASRRPFARGVGFELEDRGLANQKVQSDFSQLQAWMSMTGSMKVAARHYLCGMGLLALEDSIPGLIDAAYMQFYQCVEALVGTHSVKDAKKEIAKMNLPGSFELQLVCHQIFCVRHKYFGHGNETNFHEIADQGVAEATRVARQVLVARWLAKAIFDALSPSRAFLAREMRIYGPEGSSEFRGQVSDLEGVFWVNFGQAAGKAKCETYDSSGAEGRTYMFPELSI